MLSVNGVKLNNNKAVNFSGGRAADYRNVRLSNDPQTLDVFLKSTEAVRKPDFALGERSLAGLVKDQLNALYEVMFDPKIAKKGKQIEKDLRDIVDKTENVKKRFDKVA